MPCRYVSGMANVPQSLKRSPTVDFDAYLPSLFSLVMAWHGMARHGTGDGDGLSLVIPNSLPSVVVVVIMKRDPSSARICDGSAWDHRVRQVGASSASSITIAKTPEIPVPMIVTPQLPSRQVKKRK